MQAMILGYLTLVC